MIKDKRAIIGSVIILGICMYLFFPFPNDRLVGARTTFMSFPIRDQDGFVFLGIIGSILFILAMVLLFKGLKKYHFRTMIAVAIVYAVMPLFLITMYQTTLASGISAISYDGEGSCAFQAVEEGLLEGKCDLLLHNRSNETVSFELEFLDSYYFEDDAQMESLMNLAGPHVITIETKQKKSIHLEELLNVKNIPNHIDSGSSYNIHIKIVDGESTRIL